MKSFTGYQYLLIDAANQWGLDKLTFEERISWTESNLHKLEALDKTRDPWKERPLYLKAVMAIRQAQRGEASGHLVGLDAVCSGMQIMSALTGCVGGASATGLVDPDVRADAYTQCAGIMNTYLVEPLDNIRKSVKNAVMTHLYGSTKEPEKEFGKDSDALGAFYKAMDTMAPGANDLLDKLLGSWAPYSLTHEWQLPDGFDVVCRNMAKKKVRVEVDELKHRFNYIYEVNEGAESGVSNAANVIHSIDAYVLRSLIRRCSFDRGTMWEVKLAINDRLNNVHLKGLTPNSMKPGDPTENLLYFVDQFERSTVVDLAILPYLDEVAVYHLAEDHLRALQVILKTIDHEPFDVLTVHDEFKCHANHMNHLRKHYRNILAELAESLLLDDLLSQLYHQDVRYPKLSRNLGSMIRNSNYALC